MNNEPMIKFVRLRLTERKSGPSRMHRFAKQLAWRSGGAQTLLVLMLLGLIAICGGISAQAQTEAKAVNITEEKAINVVDTAAVLARLQAKSAYSLALENRSRMEPARGGMTADGVSPDQAVSTSAQSGASREPRFQMTPYLWMSGIKGSVGAGDRIADVNVGFTEIFDEVNFGGAAVFEAQWGGR